MNKTFLSSAFNSVKLICCFVTASIVFIFIVGWGEHLEPVPTIECKWEHVGPGGGGGMYYPTFSPFRNTRLMTLSCDMGGTYRSTDNGLTWNMMDFGLQGRTCGPIGYDSTDANILYAVKFRQLWKTSNQGRTWKSVADVKGIGNDDIVVDPVNPRKVWIAMTLQAVTPIFSTDNRGISWKPSSKGIPDRSEVRGLHLDLSSPVSNRRLYAATNRGFYISRDSGRAWHKMPQLSGEEFLDFVGTVSTLHSQIFFAVIKGKGIYRSDNSGDSWEQSNNGLPSNGSTCKLLAIAKSNPNIIYSVIGVGEIWRSDNGGRQWKKVHDATKDTVADCWITKDLGPAWAGNILGIAVNPFDANDIVYTDYMRACRSSDGGRTWRALHTRRSTNGWSSTGLDVTTSYKLTFDPTNSNHQFISNGDIGLIQSNDNGINWQRTVTGVPNLWYNTCYDIAIDPEDTNVVWGAFSRLHDLPHSNGNLSGGICLSRNKGKNWSACKGLPNAPGTTVQIDPKSNPHSRVLYAGLFTKGVYKSIDGGRTWSNKSRGLPGTGAVWRISLNKDGILLCVVTRHQKQQGGLYISTDGAETWRPLFNGKAFEFPLEALFDPLSSNVIYATSFGDWDNKAGGLYKSMDGGFTWEQLLRERQIWGITVDPNKHDRVYACCMSTGSGPTHGILMSKNGGKTWKRLGGLPFYNLHSVTVDPRNSKVIYVTTFGGGVWKTSLPDV